MKKSIKSITSIICILLSLTYIHATAMIEGPSEALIPNAKQSIVQYTTIANYQFEPLLLTGITLDSDGLLTITKEATPQTLTIYVTNGIDRYSKTITLQYSWSKQNPEFKKYQIKDSIEPLSNSKILTNHAYLTITKYSIFIIGILILLGYIKKRREQD